jgi:hypothetical protein
MTESGSKPIRFGGKSKPKIPFLLYGGIAAAVIVAIVVFLIVTSKSGDVEEETGCRSDQDCSGGRMCASGGCIIMLASEHRGLWQEDIKLQNIPSDGGPEWAPHKTAGERLPATSVCPVPRKKVSTPNEGKTLALANATVHVFDSEEITVFGYRRAKSEVWIDSLRIWFPGQETISTTTPICGSRDVAAVKSGQGQHLGKKSFYINTSLKKAAPAGAATSAAVSFKRPIGPADPEGYRTSSLFLAPAIGGDTRYYSVIILPLGTDIISIKGPPPAQQRLSRGYFSYYWEHDASMNDVTIRYRVPENTSLSIDFSTVNP